MDSYHSTVLPKQADCCQTERVIIAKSLELGTRSGGRAKSKRKVVNGKACKGRSTKTKRTRHVPPSTLEPQAGPDWTEAMQGTSVGPELQSGVVVRPVNVVLFPSAQLSPSISHRLQHEQTPCLCSYVSLSLHRVVQQFPTNPRQCPGSVQKTDEA